MTEKIDTLWVTDAELIRRSGVPEKVMRQRLKFYDAHPGHGFPRKNHMFADRRYWPAVVDFFAKNAGMTAPNGRERGTMDGPPQRRKVHASA